jgi:hypothetical protein
LKGREIAQCKLHENEVESPNDDDGEGGKIITAIEMRCLMGHALIVVDA